MEWFERPAHSQVWFCIDSQAKAKQFSSSFLSHPRPVSLHLTHQNCMSLELKKAQKLNEKNIFPQTILCFVWKRSQEILFIISLFSVRKQHEFITVRDSTVLFVLVNGYQTVMRIVLNKRKLPKKHHSTPHSPASSYLWKELTSSTAIGGHHQELWARVLDNVLPVDGVSMTQELVLVNIHSPIQDLCEEKRENSVKVWFGEKTEWSFE